jgi:hypothetical protein
MVEPPVDHRKTARAILLTDAPLREKEGQFLGGLAYRAEPISERQANWLAVLVRRYGPKDGGAHE